jgi:hypothetical protein
MTLTVPSPYSCHKFELDDTHKTLRKSLTHSKCSAVNCIDTAFIPWFNLIMFNLIMFNLIMFNLICFESQ